MLASGHMAGTIQIPGHPQTSAECPPDLLEAEPQLPKLNLMASRADLFPEIPTPLIRQWVGHELGGELEKFMAAIHDEFGPVPDAKPSDATGGETGADASSAAAGADAGGANPDAGGANSAKKRKGQATPATVKRAKVDRAKVLPTSDTHCVQHALTLCWGFMAIGCRGRQEQNCFTKFHVLTLCAVGLWGY